MGSGLRQQVDDSSCDTELLLNDTIKKQDNNGPDQDTATECKQKAETLKMLLLLLLFGQNRRSVNCLLNNK